MLTRLRFKNWRSLRNVTIDDLMPITVFIGANSSGKTNILDALYFWRYAHINGGREAIYAWRGREKMPFTGSDDLSTELEMSFSDGPKGLPFTKRLKIDFDPSSTSAKVSTRMTEGTQVLYDLPPNDVMDPTPRIIGTEWRRFPDDAERRRQYELIELNSRFSTERWQLLDENFMPPTALPSDSVPGELYVTDPCAQTTLFMLDFMRQERPDIYADLQADLKWLLGYVDSLETVRDDRETRFSIKESALQGHEASTISAGTSRLIAMLTAYYALDMRSPELPGLVVIEEPDTAINPLLLRNFVSLLRTYVDREDRPRQFILTTHNPQLLDWFEPEEVRVVERDAETGETRVDNVPDYIREIWLQDHKLGDAWLSRVIGGIPQE